MGKGFSDEIAELQQVHKGLVGVTETDDKIIVFGPLSFEASASGYETIVDSFDVELIIHKNYPKKLPSVRETGGKILKSYDHINEDRTLCLAVPIEERRLYLIQPTLLGFVNKLVVPYLYGYCYWKEHGKHPFDESEHGSKGIIQYYRERLKLNDENSILAIISFLYEYGYRGHHYCPCGSGKKVRNCHGEQFQELLKLHSDHTLELDFVYILNHQIKKAKNDNYSFPNSLETQVSRILKKRKPKVPNKSYYVRFGLRFQPVDSEPSEL